MIPGGLGSFDLVFIWGTQNLLESDEKVLALLIFYRLGYFIIPFIISTVLFIKEYWEKWNHSWNDLPNSMIQMISHVLLTIMVFLSGLDSTFISLCSWNHGSVKTSSRNFIIAHYESFPPAFGCSWIHAPWAIERD